MQLLLRHVIRKIRHNYGTGAIRYMYYSSTSMDISTAPSDSQHIEHEGKKYTTVKEGLAYILVPSDNPIVPQQSPLDGSQTQDVFYNPIQQFNRDLSVLTIKTYGNQIIEQQKRKEKEKALKKTRGKERDKKRKRDDLSENGLSMKIGRTNITSPQAGNEISEEAMTENVVAQTVKSSATSSVADENCPSVEVKETEIVNADTSSQALNHEPNFTILDALSATGLRALRYAHEIPFTTSVTANDLLPTATEQIKLNILHNKLTSKIVAKTGNAIRHMYNLIDNSSNSSAKNSKYNVIDLDPYGSAAPFLDAAVQAIRDGGLLCITCTDAAVWASNGWPEKCFALYGGVPLKGPLSHEAGLRLILHAVATSAARYGLAITPLLSLSIDFYARLFVRIHKSAQQVKFLAGKTMMVYNCDTGCGAWTTQMLGRNRFASTKKGNLMWKHGLEQGPSAKETCAECGFKTHIGGPMYAGLLHDPEFVQQILDGLKDEDEQTYQTIPRIRGMLTVALEECLPPTCPTNFVSKPDNDAKKEASNSSLNQQAFMTGPSIIDPAPFFFMLPMLSKVLHTVTPHENAIRGALRHLGYRATRSHTKGGCIKTDAPWSEIWRIMRAWVTERSPVKEDAMHEKTAGWKILGLGLSEEERRIRDLGPLSETESSGSPSKVIFDEKLGSEKDRNKLVRYQQNPRENWGPMARAKGKQK
ncbi:tRNA -dimethyltransferase [Golovinomyces cichoracearum]|uniref:tRNA (guanine(26)-N(2))-dimethyltransferase n=1 Tax=Golovinomyces cichoracearum TaxID=62708 RepID=A0A420HU93_9PEZI|nr:tRNA -dimethyltransferase [Golovinomyces cichoracearum]